MGCGVSNSRDTSVTSPEEKEEKAEGDKGVPAPAPAPVPAEKHGDAEEQEEPAEPEKPAKVEEPKIVELPPKTYEELEKEFSPFTLEEIKRIHNCIKELKLKEVQWEEETDSDPIHTKCHDHELKQLDLNTAWICSEALSADGKCDAGKKIHFPGDGMKRFCCKADDYTMCESCYQKERDLEHANL